MERLSLDANYEWVAVTDELAVDPTTKVVGFTHVDGFNRPIGPSRYPVVCRRPRVLAAKRADRRRKPVGIAYMNPGPSQQTNLRMNAELGELVADDHVVTLERVKFESIRLGGAEIATTPLADKHVRVMLEHALLLTAQSQGISTRNA